VGRECVGLTPERPAMFAGQLVSLTALVENDTGFAAGGEGGRQFDGHRAAFEGDGEAFAPDAGGLVGEFQRAGDAVEIQVHDRGAGRRDVAFHEAGRGAKRVAGKVYDVAIDVEERVVA